MFFCHALVPLLCPFECSRLNTSPFEWYSKSKRNSIEVMVVNGMFLLSCRIKIVGKFCDRQCFLIDTFFVLFRSFRGRYTGLIVPEGLFWKRVFQTSFLCQIVVKSLRKFFYWQCLCLCFFALFFGKHIQVAHISTGVEFWWLLAQDGAGGFKFAGNAFKVIGAATDIDELKKVRFASRFLRFFHLKVSWQLISRVSLSATCAMSSWFVGVCECGQTTCSTELFVVKKAEWCSLKVFPPLPCGILCAVRRLRKKRNWALQLQKLIFTSKRLAFSVLPIRCKWGWNLPLKSYCVFLALCVVRTLLFAGWQLDQADKNERKPAWHRWR